ncbi:MULTISPECIES: hypothetical protein [unclassified Lysinibacillus]|uniref:hypothetical protein n=1 Tax=unclassified Lysinibacillus TaxID=2636778 RepID=UPI00255565F0|nr:MULTISPECIES: hypothetical protein [unclassified Lysinibacillus]MDM5249526.1 hypothetical protein [Lysinibacillus sp. G4S2]
MKYVFKGLLLFFTLALFFSLIVHAEKNEQEQGESDEGTVVYHVKYDYDAISNFLGMSLDEYEEYWKKGLSIMDMAEKQGISRHDLVGYFCDFHHKEMQKWRDKGSMTESDYFDLVFRLSDEIDEFIDRNPNR